MQNTLEIPKYYTMLKTQKIPENQFLGQIKEVKNLVFESKPPEITIIK